MPKLDHLVYAVPDLARGIEDFEKLTGLRPRVGGKHPEHGTHNALVGLSNGAYFEIIAPDPDSSVAPPRWMGVDLLTEPKITRWCLRTDDLSARAERLRHTLPGHGELSTGKRQTPEGILLHWKMTLPLPTPEVDIIPFFIDWSNSEAHPAESLDAALHLHGLELYHPEAERMQILFRENKLDVEIREGEEIAIRVTLDTSAGKVRL